ncbi:MAG: RNA-binding S4 domain-containing protein [Cyanobacteria bacterium]|nr:RNA-binding S4 domain-containing protein [Cyanobacteriota bacterium]
MRLDKFLKLSRLIKRRTLANEFCDAGSALMDKRTIKASYEVKVGDVLTLKFGNRTMVIRVEVVPTRAPSVQEAASLYTIVSEEWKKNAPDLEFPNGP